MDRAEDCFEEKMKQIRGRILQNQLTGLQSEKNFFSTDLCYCQLFFARESISIVPFTSGMAMKRNVRFSPPLFYRN